MQCGNEELIKSDVCMEHVWEICTYDMGRSFGFEFSLSITFSEMSIQLNSN